MTANDSPGANSLTRVGLTQGIPDRSVMSAVAYSQNIRLKIS